jgi:hypothetical protein
MGGFNEVERHKQKAKFTQDTVDSNTEKPEINTRTRTTAVLPEQKLLKIQLFEFHQPEHTMCM